MLDQLPPDQRAEVEAMAAAHPEVKRELSAVEETLENLALAGAAPLPAGGLAELNSRIDNAEGRLPTAPASTKVPPGRTTGYSGLIATACALLAVGCILLGYFYFQEQSAHDRTRQDLETLRSTCEERTSDYNQLTRQIAFLTDTASTRITLEPTPFGETATAAVFYNSRANETRIDPSGLPALSASEQYQLWAIVDGTPVSLLVFDAVTNQENPLLSAEDFTGTPQLFAITIEPRGGSEGPTMDKMVVAGKG
ncbi:MAG: anti-sigma factor [Saprospiraceae bacterium]